jgi:hypothetical protein
MQEVLQNVPYVFKVESFFRQGEKAGNCNIIVVLLNTPVTTLSISRHPGTMTR